MIWTTLAAHYHLFSRGSSSVAQDDGISLSQTATQSTLLLQDSDPVIRDDNPSKQPARSPWYSLCYFLHIALVALHLILVVIFTSHHLEHRIIIVANDSETFTTGLSIGLQAFYTLYTALLVFVTQSLMLSTVFSGPTKLTQIHDICGAWGGLGAALSALWQQTKVASSISSVTLVMSYFVCISMLHVAGSTIMQFQPFNETTTSSLPVVATWPGPGVNLPTFDWMATTTLSPFLQKLYGNTTRGLANNTLYDVPTLAFDNATVNATTINARCGLLTNLSADYADDASWNINVSTMGLDPFNIQVPYPPLSNEIWLSPSIHHSQPYIIYLVSAEIDANNSVCQCDQSWVNINGTYSPPGSVAQNFMTPTYFVACTLSATSHAATLETSEVQLDLGEQPTYGDWSTFSPSGDKNLTRAISHAMNSANTLPPSQNCQPIMSQPYWANITAFNAYMRSTLGMDVSSCSPTSPTSLENYTGTPFLLTKDRVETVTSMVAAEFMWLAGQLGKDGGGFNRQTEEGEIMQTVLQWRLNINLLPLIFSLSASVFLCVLVLCMLWGKNRKQQIISATGVLEIMWFGSRSQTLRDHLGGVRNPSVDDLRASSMFETVLWGHTAHVRMDQERNGLYAAVPLYDIESSSSSPRPLPVLRNDLADDSLHWQLLNKHKAHHIGGPCRSRRWCYALHIILVVLHVILLPLLVRHPEHSVIIPFESGKTMSAGLSALLQAIYTLYSALLVLLLQQLASSKIIAERQKMTSVHDISGAWSGIGAAILILWQQRKVTSSTSQVMAVVIYLTSMLVLHITSSSIMQWQGFENSILIGVLQTDLALPNSAVNINQIQWPEIFPVARSVVQDPSLSMYGLVNSTLYDIPQVPENGTYSKANISATILNVQCGLVPNLTFISYQDSEGQYQLGFSDGTNNASFLVPPMWKDVVLRLDVECPDCPQTLFYMITTGIHVDNSVHYSVSVDLNWTYTPSGESPQTSSTLTYISACSIVTRTIPTMVNVQERKLVSSSGFWQAAVSTSPSWMVWSPTIPTNISVGMTTALSKDTTGGTGMFQGDPAASVTDMDIYIMSLLGLDMSAASTASATQSSADPSVTLTPAQLENAIGQTAARFLWLAGQLGESGGGFDRTLGQGQAMQDVLEWRLNLNTAPIIFASIASFTALAVAIFILGKNTTQQGPSSVSGTSVLESLWLEANSEVLHSHLQAIEEPCPDRLRAMGTFDICLGDVTVRCSSREPESQEVAVLSEHTVADGDSSFRLSNKSVSESTLRVPIDFSPLHIHPL